MSKKKLTNREIKEMLDGLSKNDKMLNTNDQILWKEIVEIKQAFSLYLEYRNKTFNEDVNGFNQFVKTFVETEELEQKKQSKDKERA